MTTMKRLSGVCVLILGFQLHVAVFAASTPTDTVKDTVEGVLATLADPSLDEQSQRYNVMTLIATRFNFPGMSKRILATNWKNADERQRERFVELFSQILGIPIGGGYATTVTKKSNTSGKRSRTRKPRGSKRLSSPPPTRYRSTTACTKPVTAGLPMT